MTQYSESCSFRAMCYPNIAIPLTLPSACVGNWHRKLGSCHLLCRTSWNDQAMSEPYCIFTCHHCKLQRFCQQTVTSRSFWWLMPPFTARSNVSIDGAWRGGCWHVYFILYIVYPQSPVCGVVSPNLFSGKTETRLGRTPSPGPFDCVKDANKKQLWKPPSCELDVLIWAMFKTFLTFHYTWLVHRGHHNSLL